MENQVVNRECFVVLPADEMNTRYNAEYFGHVYERLILPSVIESGFIPVKIDKNTLEDKGHLELLRKMTDVPVALFDISVRGGWTMTLLGIRNVYKMPVILIQSDEVPKVFDSADREYIEYDFHLTEPELEISRRKIIEALKVFHE